MKKLLVLGAYIFLMIFMVGGVNGETSKIDIYEVIQIDNPDFPEIFEGVLNYSKIYYSSEEGEIIVWIIEFSDEEALKASINKTTDPIDLEHIYSFEDKNYLMFKDFIEWTNNNYLIHIESNSVNLLENPIFDYYSSTYFSNVKILSKKFSSFSVLAPSSSLCSLCGVGWTNNCDKDECYNLVDSCYLGWASCTGWGDCYCYDGSSLYNGHSDYCNYKGQRKGGCNYGEYDCDYDSECSSNFDCVDYDGYICLMGLECGCCNVGEKWNTGTNSCQKITNPSITSIYWSPTSANTGDTVSLNIQTQDISNGNSVKFDIIEDDMVTSICSGNSIGSFYSTINNNFALINWVVANGDDLIGNLEYCFKATVNSKSATSNNLDTLFGYNGWDCDSSSQCTSNLVCDGNTPIIDTENEGCCYEYENWNDPQKNCNPAVKGKVYQVSQQGQTFSENVYSNLKLRVYVEDVDLVENDIVDYFDVYTDSNGNFKFNPERYIAWWNNPTLFVDYQIYAIYAIDNNEIIGKWTNHFSNKNNFNNAEDWVNQIVRIHQDKPAWKRNYFPELDSTTILSSSKTLSASSSEPSQEMISLNWKGYLQVENSGDYKILFNVSDYLLLKINNETLIDTEDSKLNSKLVQVNLNEYNNTLEFELKEKASNNPVMYLGYNDEPLKEINSSNLYKIETKIQFIKDQQQKFSVQSAESINNNYADYMISFLDVPKVIRNQKPIIFIHGKHGESGYWNEEETQEQFQNKGYDAWEFYYSGEDDIPMSGALLGDSTLYLKNHYYGSSQKFDVIAHSMGGLVSRSYVQNISSYNYKNDVNHLILLASPSHGSGASNGISEDWIISGIGSLFFDDYSNFEDWRIGYSGASNSPIYKQMALGSDLIFDLGDKNLPTKNYVIIGNSERLNWGDVIEFDKGAILCSLTDNFGHKESDSEEYDCLVSISSSSLLNQNIPLSIINGYNHATEVSRLDEYSQIILDFLNDKSDGVLASNSYSYYNPETGYSKSFFNKYSEGSVQIKVVDNGNIWNPSSNLDLQIQKISTQAIYNLNRNPHSKNYYHFNKNSNQLDSYYTLPIGEYRVIIPNVPDSQNLHFDIATMQTSIMVLNLCIPNLINTSWSDWQNISCLSNNLMNQSRFLTQYDSNSCQGSQNQTIYEYRAILNCGTQENNQTNLIINSPILDLFDNRRILLNLETTEEVDEIVYTYFDSRGRLREKRLCRNCDEYNRKVSFSDGTYKLTFKAIVEDVTIDEESVSFLVDSKDPRISKTSPTRGFSDGNFYVEFKEDNPENLTLYYGNSIRTQELDIEKDCSEIRGKHSCKVWVNLTDFDNQKIEYWFELEDIAGNKDESKKREVDVDMTSPVLNNPDDFWEMGTGRYDDYVYFDMSITEMNFDKVVLSYDYRGKTKEKRLCSRLRYGKCEKKFKLREKYTNYQLIIRDDAGNSDSRDISF